MLLFFPLYQSGRLSTRESLCDSCVHIFMPMSETMSNPGDWLQFYQHNVAGQPQKTPATIFTDRVSSDATVVTTTVTSAASTASPHGPGNISPSGSGHLSPEGRVSKPIRRRSRASRRTPTTLLNTDTTNFRAMVQRFTGGPNASFVPPGSQYPGAENFNFGLGVGTSTRPQIANLATNSTTAVMVPSAYHLQFQQQQQHHQRQQYHQQQQHMFSLNRNTIHGRGDGLLHRRLSNSRPNMEVSDGFLVDGISSHAPPRAASSNANRSNDNNFIF